MKVTVDQAKCVSTGNCVANAPDIFDQDEDDGSVRLLIENPSPDRAEAVHKAVKACPAQAISVQD
ncbi:MAG TPA: ferredoxin [Mycobacterium sp.]|nr:ferredoxin [Mycobacterium sp.]